MSLLKPKLTLDAFETIQSAARRLAMKPDSLRRKCGIAKNLRLIRLTDGPRGRFYVVRDDVDKLIRECLKKIDR